MTVYGDTACRSCGAPGSADLGRLPDAQVFAGRVLPQPLPGGRLRRCGACGFVFRTPILAPAEYAALYAGGGTEVWDAQAGREDFRLVREAVPDAPLDVLDVGCYTGELLALLPVACRRFGVEPNPGAAARAAARGVEIVAQQWEVLDGHTRSYDLITCCDMIEHVPEPGAFLSTLARRLKPQGRLLLTTGDAQAWPWRLAEARSWYFSFPEHISFIGAQWLQRKAPSAGLRVQRLSRFWHGTVPGPAARARALAVTAAWRLAAPWVAHSRSRLLGSDIAPDHLFCELAKD